MKLLFTYIFLSLALFSSCKQDKIEKDPIVKPDTILKDIMSFLVYRERYVKLSENFIALDPAFNNMTKEAFLKSLSSGNYLPLRLVSKDSSAYYKLYKLNSSVSNDIRETVKNWEARSINIFKWKEKNCRNLNLWI